MYEAAAGPTHAVVAPVDLHVIHGADAGVVPDGVVAVSGPADAGSLALVDICRQTEKSLSCDLRSEREQLVRLHLVFRDNFSARMSSRCLQDVKKKKRIPGAEHHYSGQMVKWSPWQSTMSISVPQTHLQIVFRESGSTSKQSSEINCSSPDLPRVSPPAQPPLFLLQAKPFCIHPSLG